MGKLAGYKTYIAAITAVIAAIGAYLTGDVDLRTLLQSIWTIAEPLAIVFLAAKGNRILAATNAAGAQPLQPVKPGV